MADSPPLRSAPKLLLILKSTAAGERVAVSPIDDRCRPSSAPFPRSPGPPSEAGRTTQFVLAKSFPSRSAASERATLRPQNCKRCDRELAPENPISTRRYARRPLASDPDGINIL